MAHALKVVKSSEADVDSMLFDDFDDAEDVDSSELDAISIEDASDDAARWVEEAVDFMQDDMEPLWAEAEAFYDGKSDIKKEPGRSQVTSTDVRDAVRALKPSIMRVFTQADDIVEYFPKSVATGPLAVVQTRFVNDLFWDAEGYRVLQDTVHDAMLRKIGIIKTWWDDSTEIEYMDVDGLTSMQLDYIDNLEDVKVVSSEGEDGSISAEIAILKEGGTLRATHVPLFEFFVNDAATCPDDASVIGQRRNIPVGEAIALGFALEDLEDLDGYDLEQDDFSEESEQRRGYIEETGDDIVADPIMRKVLITEAYLRFDLDGLGVPQLYRFWLGGTQYHYLSHERVESNPYEAIQIDPIPDAFFGRSIFDLLKEDQNTSTSIIRATCDNAHLSNNVRLAVHESMVNMDDVLNNTIGYPIRFRAPGMIQEIGVQSSVGSMLPLLQFLHDQGNNKVGVTDAALGLDPDALQSTDKNAVANTIQMSQGQVELMARNITETGLIGVFKKLLKLSMQHKAAEQATTVNGSIVDVNQEEFDGSMAMRTKVGLGTAGFDMKLAGLNNVLIQQKEIIGQYGLDNPIVTVQNVYNTISDITRMMGLTDVTRYFNTVTPEVAQQIQAKAAQAASQDQGATDPGQAIIQAETVKAQATMEGKKLDAQIDQQKMATSTKANIVDMLMKDDLARDKMAQDVEIESAKILGGEINKFAIAKEQNKARSMPTALTGATGDKP